MTIVTPPGIIPLGPFRLHEQIGRGGMGEVWSATHLGQNLPVAVKVMTEARARNPKYLNAFSNEVRSVARLDHPGVVMVFDYGEVPEETQVASKGRVAAGCPFLVMELASGGSLAHSIGPYVWPQLRGLLLNLLEALAHAHARDVIHRDLKPANILLSIGSDQRPGLKISDFGIAHARDRDTPLLKGAGTPRYMAPEQIVRRWRDHGPWTDLYALGCMAYHLATGAPPFPMSAPKAVLEAHLSSEAPPMDPKAAVPAGFEGWVRRLMMKSPHRRFRRAADAAWALMRLGPPFIGPGSEGIASTPAIFVPAAAMIATMTFQRVDVEDVVIGDDTVVEDTPAPTGMTAAIPASTAPGATTVEGMGLRLQIPPYSPSSPVVHVALQNGFEEFNSQLNPAGEVGVGLEGLPTLSSLEGAESSIETLRTPSRKAQRRPDGAPDPSVEDPITRTHKVLLPARQRRPTGHAAPWVPPMPSSWRKQTRPGSDYSGLSMQLVGAGLGLFGLRQVPLVGRREARDMLWSSLKAVRDDGNPRLVALTGPAGVGKSRLVEWMSERAHEVGASEIMRAEHTEQGSGDALADMLTTYLQCQGMSNVDTCRRLEQMMRPLGVDASYEWRALAEIISPVGGEAVTDTSRLVYFPQESARFGVIRRLIARVGQVRPVIIWLDDVQWGVDSLALVQHLLAGGDDGPIPCLIVMTIQQEALVERPLEQEKLRPLLARPEATTAEVGPLDIEQRRTLVSGLLRLSGELANRVAERTGGNPLFAVQLVGDWVERGVLEVGRDGFVLSPTQTVDLPDDLHAVWGARVARLIEGMPPAVMPMLEVAAALGHAIDPWEWHVAATESVDVQEALARATVPRRAADVAQRVLAVLTESHLVEREGAEGWSFVHGMLRESIQRAAVDGGRWARHHSACAAMLKKCYPLGGRGIAERLARHLQSAQRSREAIDPLLRAAIERRESSEFGAAEGLLWQRERALVDAEVPESDVGWGEGWVLRCRLDEDRNLLDEALRWAKTARDQAKRWRWDAVLADSLCVTGTILSRRGQQLDASDAFLQAKQCYDRLGDSGGVARCLRGLGTAAALAGKFEEGGMLLTTAQRLFERAGLKFEVAHCMRAQANLAWTQGLPERAGTLYRETQAVCEEVGDRLGAGLCMTGLGEVARAAGELDKAEDFYRQGIAALRQLDSGWEYYQSHLALVLLARGGYREARRLLQRVAMLTEQQEELGILGCVQMALTTCAAGMDDWSGWDDHFARATDLLRVTGLIEPDVAWCAELAAELAAQLGEDQRARQALVLARSQYVALDNSAGIASVDEHLRMLHGRRPPQVKPEPTFRAMTLPGGIPVSPSAARAPRTDSAPVAGTPPSTGERAFPTGEDER